MTQDSQPLPPRPKPFDIMDARSPVYAKADNSSINLEVAFRKFMDGDSLVYIPFTADPNDMYDYSATLFNNAEKGDYGSVGAYTAT